MLPSPVKIINLKNRIDRFKHIQNQFEDKREFACSILSTSKQANGRFGLWNNLVKVVKEAKKSQQQYVIFCEDDHQFTGSYRYKNLLRAIKEADRYEADLLLGGVSWFDNALQVSAQLFWICHFTGLQFTIIYDRFYDTIINAKFAPLDVADLKLSELSFNKFVMHPFISIQQEFGYSDITTKNNEKGYVKQLFRSSSATLTRLKKVKNFYHKIIPTPVADDNFSDISIPTYVISYEDKAKRRTKIEAQFKDRAEFDITLIEECGNKTLSVLLWQSILKIVQLAIDNDEDVIIICKDSHQFTLDYNKEFLLKNIIEAHRQGAEILFGNMVGLDQVVPVTSKLYWLNLTEESSFFIIYRSLFQKILSSTFNEEFGVFQFFSTLSSHKMLFYPFISVNAEWEGVNKIQSKDKVRLRLVENAIRELNILKFSDGLL